MRFAHWDDLTAAGGPAGIEAALAAGRTGARVLLVDEQSEFGGQLLWRRSEIDGGPAQDWLTTKLDELAAMKDVRLLPRSTVAGYYDHNFLTILERVTDHLPGGTAPAGIPRRRLWKIRAREVVLATGAIERPLVFVNNDLPGIMLAGAAQSYIRRYGVRPGSRAIIFTNNDSAYELATSLGDAGVTLATIVDARDGLVPAAGECRRRGIEVLSGHALIAATGAHELREGTIAPLAADGVSLAGKASTIVCDLLCVSGGWSPSVHLFSQSGGRVVYDGAKACFVPGQSVQPERSAGGAAANFGLADCLEEGYAAGLGAAPAAGFDASHATAAPPAPGKHDPTRPSLG